MASKKQPTGKTKGEKGRSTLRPSKLALLAELTTKLIEMDARTAYTLYGMAKKNDTESLEHAVPEEVQEEAPAQECANCEAKRRRELALLNASMLLEDLLKRQLN